MCRSVILFLLLFSLVRGEEGLRKGLLERIIQPKVTLESSYIADANIQGSRGSVEVHKNRLRVNNKMIGLSYTHWGFSWDDIPSLPFGDQRNIPIQEMHAFKLSVNLPYSINEKWFLLTSASIRSVFEKNTQDAYGAGLFSFASYKLNNDHTIQMGAFVNYHKISTLALPVISYSYRARKTDGLQVVLGFPRTYIGYHAHKDTLFKMGMIFSQSVIKLRSDSPIEHSGFIEAEDYMGNIGIMHTFNEDFSLEGNILYSLKRDFVIYDHSGTEQNSYKINPSFGMNLRLKWVF